MKIRVRLFGVLQIGRFQEEDFVYPAGTSIADVIDDLKLPCQHVVILLVNGVHAGRDHLLQDGDILALLPMVDGG